VFAGGFDLQSACAIAGSDDVDDYAVLDLLDALVRKSLLVADRSSGRTRFSMLYTYVRPIRAVPGRRRTAADLVLSATQGLHLRRKVP
jgi:predicted ATPase